MGENEVKFHEEIQKMEYEPLEPAEISLVKWSLGLGVTLLVLLFVVSKFLLPGVH
ncbi:bacteriocin-type signal sequence [Candidatus Desulfovibrio trichonymphae]|uniref:Bacteriocin-type signal sequence n=1 Tax=Candidatus Desulfovibrio trichonymphae TaxID=1725232 RepID=A0A1J1E272_9BACT|nr:bacteriocin-type signal sequence [Candidatus Desulfovibrio trichonymphae]BAV91528.1 conserved hypothetical protein [Candidatus Desulfovibrio trichonymphae]GHU97168.1 hypothetical protein AGMMS50248_00600 [Deltaproteobacteria bacterium]